MNRQARNQIRVVCHFYGMELHRQAINQLHYLVEGKKLSDLSRQLKTIGCYLVTVICNDERELEDRCFKLYYVFSHPTEDLFLIIENPLERDRIGYSSIHEIYPAVEPFEHEITDFFGLFPKGQQERIRPASYLHPIYPSKYYPLRRDNKLADPHPIPDEDKSLSAISPVDPRSPPKGEVYLPVGPIHAGVIEPGQFLFRIGSEVIEGLEIRLGYTHKGIERLFQTHFSLQDGWQLAENVSGDSSFAHSMAYCQAIEALADISIPIEAAFLRALFLELERLTNHIGDIAALAHDVALDIVASELAVLREELMALNKDLAGNRFLRGLNRPGGVVLSHPLVKSAIQTVVSRVKDRALEMSSLLVKRNDFRERTINIGILPKYTAHRIGVTGLVARASGVNRDFRLQHSLKAYTDERISAILQNYMQDGDLFPVLQRTMAGDVFSRFLIRAQEIDLSAKMILAFLEALPSSAAHDFVQTFDFSNVPNFEFGLGHVEGWRGDIVYWIMKDKFDRIYRCKVRDPSTLNWPGLKAAVEPHEMSGKLVETTIVDFPIINKSFNLSYSGNDL